MQDRLPAYPLFVKDPFFSFWANGDNLTDCDVIFWTGAKKPMSGRVSANGTERRFLGAGSASALLQTSRRVTAYTTEYVFECEEYSLFISFVSPLFFDDPDTLSCPVCRLSYNVTPKTELRDFRISFEIGDDICYTGEEIKSCRSGVLKRKNYEAAYIGLRTQAVLSHSSDLFGADWGYYYLTGENCDVSVHGGRKFIRAENASRSGCFMLAFDDIASIYYYGQVLRGYYFRNGDKNICDAIEESYERAEEIDEKCKSFDEKLKKDAEACGNNYYRLLVASLRQSIAAHKLVQDGKGRLLFLSKECNSDGCVATVDVTYPSAPLYLLYNPELVRGMMRPILDFARMPIWEYDFAPHDAGMYPYVTGQLYAAQNGEERYNKDIYVDFSKKEVLPFYYLMGAETDVYTEERQMQIEESANMLLLAYACYLMDKNFGFIDENFDLLSRWGDYLTRNGPEYGRQLCTDDFAGHLEGNLNLSVKATIALGVYAKILSAKGLRTKAEEIENTAKGYVEKIIGESCVDGHLPIAFGAGEDTYSLKYNLVFDQIVGTNLFDCSIGEREACYYEKLCTGYGVPLDSRLRETKSDWMIWSAGISENEKFRDRMVNEVVAYLEKGGQRYPFPDWYNIDTAEAKPFRNRTVVGGHFLLLLKEHLKKIGKH